MKKFVSVQNVKQEIDSYEKHFAGAPLVVGIDGNSDYTTLLGLLKDDYGKQIIRMSDSCSMDFPPDPAFQISLISNAAKASRNQLCWTCYGSLSLLLQHTGGYCSKLCKARIQYYRHE